MSDYRSSSSHADTNTRSPPSQDRNVYPRGQQQTHPHYQYTLPRDEAYDQGRTHASPSNFGPSRPQPPNVGHVPPPPPLTMAESLPPPPTLYESAPGYYGHPPHGSHRQPYGYPHPRYLHPGIPMEPVRMDSAMGGSYDPYMASAGPQWPYPGPHGANSMARKRRGNLPKDATRILKEWFRQHHDSPYPTEEQKQMLCEQTQLQISQVSPTLPNGDVRN